MLRNDGDEKVVECNECGAEEYSGTLDFRGFVYDLKKEGWKIRKEGDEWIHICPTCAE